MNLKKAKEIARKWVEQKPAPKELNPKEVEGVLSALGFKPLGKNHDHTSFKWEHPRLENTEKFSSGILSISIGHSKGAKAVVRIGSVKALIQALEYFPEIKE